MARYLSLSLSLNLTSIRFLLVKPSIDSISSSLSFHEPLRSSLDGNSCFHVRLHFPSTTDRVPRRFPFEATILVSILSPRFIGLLEPRDGTTNYSLRRYLLISRINGSSRLLFNLVFFPCLFFSLSSFLFSLFLFLSIQTFAAQWDERLYGSIDCRL